jgi:prolyl-tRNA synthetase
MARDIEPSLPDKTTNMSTWYDEVLSRAELIDIRYGVKGFVVYRPYAMEIINRFLDMFRKELERTGHRPALFPLVIPEKMLRKEAKHIKGFEGQVFWVTHSGYNPLEEKLALRPTSETAIYPLYSLWIKSYKDLPFKLYQSVTVYRYETKATRPLLRGREFIWIESHNVFRGIDEAEEQIKEDVRIFEKVVSEKLGIPFLHLKREDFDKFAGADYSFAFDCLLPDGKVLQIGTTHYLGTNFSRAFEIKYQDEDESFRYAHQTCFGIGISRILAALILVHGDEFGLVLPFEIAPIQIVIIPIPKKNYPDDKLLDYINYVRDRLEKEGYRVEVDLSDKTPGEKYYYYDMRGVPIRIEVGPREVDNNKVTIFRRDTRVKETVEIAELEGKIREIKDMILVNLRNKAIKALEDNIVYASSLGEVLKYVQEGIPIIKVDFCGRKECADELKSETMGYETRGYSITEVEKGSYCLICGGKADHITYLAKAY